MAEAVQTQENKKMTRADFLKRTGAVAAGIFAVAKLGKLDVLAAEPVPEEKEASQVIGPLPPTNKSALWVDTSVGGVQKFWNGTEWAPVKSTWG